MLKCTSVCSIKEPTGRISISCPNFITSVSFMAFSIFAFWQQNKKKKKRNIFAAVDSCVVVNSWSTETHHKMLYATFISLELVIQICCFAKENGRRTGHFVHWCYFHPKESCTTPKGVTFYFGANPKTPCHNSISSGHKYVQKLLNGHPDKVFDQGPV